MASPLEIEIALWYHCRAGDFGKDNGQFNAPAVQCAFNDFVGAGLLALSPERCEAKYFGTDALKVWVNALCNVPFPVKEWRIPTNP